MRSTTKSLAVGSKDAGGRPTSEGKLGVPRGPTTNLMIGPNSPPLHQEDLRPRSPYLLPHSRGQHSQQGLEPSLQHHRVVLGSLNQAQPDPCPRLSTRTVRCLTPKLQDLPRPLGELLLRHLVPTYRQRGQAGLSMSRSPSMSTRAQHRKNPSQNRNLTRGESWLLIVPPILCSIRN